ncbi:DNA translocase FtsK [Botrimarina sp.]|uniref:DNA translocase FtsK n=1 Tax=Botrimarina sp. TaxID=2795802 RepID=UPI0032ED7805
MFEDRSPKFDVVAIALAVGALLATVSLVTYDPADPPAQAVWGQAPGEVRNACGRAGAQVAHSLVEMLGVGAYYAVASLGVVVTLLLRQRKIDQPVVRTVGWALSLVAICGFASTLMPGWSPGPMVGAGGRLGAMAEAWLAARFATAGSALLLGAMLLAGLLLATDYLVFRAAAVTAAASGASLAAAGRIGQAATSRIAARRPARRTDLDEVSVEADGADDSDQEQEDWEDDEESEYDENEQEEDNEDEDESEWDEAEDEDEDGPAEDTAPAKAGVASKVGGLGKRLATALKVKTPDTPTPAAEEAPADAPEGPEVAEAPAEGAPVKTPKAKSEREQIIESLEEADHRAEYDSDYELPPIDLLLPPEEFSYDQHEKEVRRKARKLEETFRNFNLNVKVVEVETGPVISQYEVELEPGLRLSKITGLADDLAIALRAPSVRIVAPIPGKNTVGIEAPNDTRQVVRLREVIEETDGQARRMKIPIFLGKDVAGSPMVVDMAALPHLLIAGRTGTGKSVCLNSIITSILMTRGPDEVRMLMIDPKMVELSGYRKLPHLMHPVVTDMKKAEAILAWAVDKMEERYTLLARAGVRHVSTYNTLTEGELRDRLESADGQPMDDAEWSLVPKQLPFIVIVADEMADLMMTAGKDVEQHIIRLAQKSRAVGIHLILATQKPTVDVITGLIKSNLPARIAFQVASRTDSRVVLDEMGADKLLGNGDMLFLSPGTSMLLRGQGTYLSDDEITRVVDFVGVDAAEQHFASELMQLKTKEEQEAIEAGTPPALKNRDDLYEAAVDVVVREGRGSVSLLQRCLGIGYGRAARLIDFMAEDGVVGEYNGSQAREVLISIAEWEAMTSDEPSEAPAAPTLKAPPTAAAPADDPAPWEDEADDAEEEWEEEDDPQGSEDDEAEVDEADYEEYEYEEEEDADSEEDEAEAEGDGSEEGEWEYEEEDEAVEDEVDQEEADDEDGEWEDEEGEEDVEGGETEPDEEEEAA